MRTLLKKNFYSIVIVTLSVLFFASCENNDPEISIPVEDLLGVWNNETFIDTCNADATEGDFSVEFLANGTFIRYSDLNGQGDDNLNLSFSIDGNRLTIVNGGDVAEYNVQLNGEKLTLTGSYEDGGNNCSETIVLTKV